MGLARRAAVFAVIFALLVSAAATEPTAGELYRTGRKYEKKKDYPNAYLFYSKAAAAAPGNKSYWQRAQALQRRAINGANILPPMTPSVAAAEAPGSPEAPPVVPEAPPEPIPEPDDQDIREMNRPQPPFELKAPPDRKDFTLRADSKSLWEEVTKAYGIGVIFDGDYEPGKVQEFHITDAGYREALHALMTATGSFFSPISDRLLLVVRDTDAKRREVETHIAVAIPLPEPFTVQEAQELGRVVQQVMEIQRLSIDSAHRVVVLRDRASKVRPAEMLYRQLLFSKAQVSLEVEFLAWNRSITRNLGTSLPTSFPIAPLIKSIALNGVGGPLTFGITLAGATLMAKKTDGEARTLYVAEIRSLDGQEAKLLVGQKYPIQTMGYVGQTTPGQQVFTPPPSFNFEDLGFNIKIKPRVHDTHELTLEVDAEFKLLAGGSLNGIPVIANRKFTTVVRLRFDEAALITGLVSKSDFRTLTGPAGLLNIPVLGTLLGSQNLDKGDSEIVVVIKPRLLTNPSSENTTQPIWIGTEGRLRIPM